MSQVNAKRFLLVKHSEGWDVDRCSVWMEQSPHLFDYCYPASGQPFPSVNRYDGVIIFGGATSANNCQEHEWLRDELRFIESCLKHNTPFFGVCLGAQMLARVLGSNVSAHNENLSEIGFCEVKPTSLGSGFLSQPLKFMQWHHEEFELPHGAKHLAYSDVFANQAYSIDQHIVGVQFHPEVNLEVLRIWHERNKAQPTGVLDDETRAIHIADAIECEQSITAWLESFLTRWSLSAVKAA